MILFKKSSFESISNTNWSSQIFSLILIVTVLSCSQSEWDNPVNPELQPLDSLRCDSIPLSCKVIISGEEYTINPWYNFEDECCSFFLPSNVDLSLIYLDSHGYQFYVDGYPLSEMTNLQQLGIKTLDNDYYLTISGKWGSPLTIKFMQSRNVATMLIKTESGSLDYIHKDKNNEESINISIYDETGKNDLLESDMACTLKGRGHGTWSQPKKPYLLKFLKKTSVLGMKKSKKWVLLANAADETNLRTWIAFRLGDGAGLKGTPQGKFIDVYANGDYLGLYFLTEKVSSKLLEENDQEPILVRIDNSVEKDSFKTDRGTIMELDNPGTGEYSIETVKEKMNQFENFLFSGEFLPNVDIDSWAKKYLVDEIMENGDAGCRSNYFYYFPSTLYLYGGPVWDYDLSLGRSKYRCGNPKTFIARREYIDPDEWTPHYSLLLANDIFSGRVKNLFVTNFLPILNKLIDYEIEGKYHELESAIHMNASRWGKHFVYIRNVFEPVACSPDELIEFLKQRIEFLKSSWIDGVNYHLVQMTYKYWNYSLYTCYSVEDGLTFNSVISPVWLEYGDSQWIDKYTGEVFNPNEIVTRDREFIFK